MNINRILFIAFLWCISTSIHGAADEKPKKHALSDLADMQKLKTLKKIELHEDEKKKEPYYTITFDREGNGCGYFLSRKKNYSTAFDKAYAAADAHEKAMREKGFSEKAIQYIIDQAATEFHRSPN